MCASLIKKHNYILAYIGVVRVEYIKREPCVCLRVRSERKKNTRRDIKWRQRVTRFNIGVTKGKQVSLKYQKIMLVSNRDRAPETDKFPLTKALDDTQIFFRALSNPIHGCSLFFFSHSTKESFATQQFPAFVFLIRINLFLWELISTNENRLWPYWLFSPRGKNARCMKIYIYIKEKWPSDIIWVRVCVWCRRIIYGFCA